MTASFVSCGRLSPANFVRALAAVVVLAFCAAPDAHAQRAETEQGLARFEETLQPKVDEGELSARGVGPVLVVGAKSAYESTRSWFPAAALQSTVRVFGGRNVRLCEACMGARVRSEGRRLEYNTALTLSDVARLDADIRGQGAPAKSALWFEETPGGVAVRLVNIANGQILFAGNFDGAQTERVRSAEVYNLSTELGRRLRGDSLTHVIIDIGLVPNQHINLDVSEQFGPYNLNLAGLTLSAIDPVVGLGIHYYRVIPLLWDFTIGVQLIASVPTAVATAISSGLGEGPVDGLIDPLLTGVLVARFPIPQTNFGVLATASTNFQFTVGISLLNVSFLPFLP